MSARSPRPSSGPSFLATVTAEVRALDVSIPSLRKFGWVVGAVFGLVGLVLLWRGGWEWTTVRAVLVGLGGTLIALGTLVPVLLRPVYRVWMTLAFAMGFVMTRVLLTLVLYGLVTPIGAIMRLLGKDPLPKRPDASMDSYWIVREDPAPSTRESLEKYY
ncbi:MAG: SxtJ family membrane protein [Bacteroidota bacterium]